MSDATPIDQDYGAFAYFVLFFEARLRVAHVRASQPSLNISPSAEKGTITEVLSQFNNRVLRDLLHIRIFATRLG